MAASTGKGNVFGGFFSLASDCDVSNFPKLEEDVCIVSIFGKSRHNPFTSKATILNPVVDKDVFQGPEGLLNKSVKDGNLECYFDAASRVVYLHLKSCYDINTLSIKCQNLHNNSSYDNFYSLYQAEDMQHAKTLLLLFTISHLMVVYHPGGNFDLSYLRLFHALDAARIKLHTSMSEVLSAVPGVSSKWSNFGRLCTPRMLFVFESPAVEVYPDDAEFTTPKSSKKPPPLRKLQMGMEDMIFRILRKTRAITNISNNSLFSVPVNQQFVYLYAKPFGISDPLDFLTSLTRQRFSPPTDASALDCSLNNSYKPKPYSQSRRKLNVPVPDPLTSSAPSSCTWANSTSSPTKQPGVFRGQEQSLKEFLCQHIDMVFAKSVNDNVGRHGVEPIFELPKLSTWFSVARKLHKFFFSEEYSNVTSHPFSLLSNSLDICTRFSENRCNKVLPLAESAYQQDLPAFYVTSHHENRLNKAKRVFTQYARGPAYNKCLQELEASCIRYWKAGRQQCEAVSLTGNLCTNKVHRLPGELPDDEREEYSHCSHLKTRAACNCGRIQMEKEDPFYHKDANYDFYQHLEERCCSKLEHIRMPAFIPSTPEPRAAGVSPHATAANSSLPVVDLKSPSVAEENVSAIPVEAGKDGEKADPFSTLSELSLALSLGQNALQASDFEPNGTGSQKLVLTPGEDNKQSAADISDGSCTTKGHHPQRQASTTEYLACMIHSRSPPGLLPLFSSFSVCRLGPSSFYSHMIGLELPGFLPGSNFLLPWDIAVKSEQAWPSVSETFGSGKKRAQRKLSKGADHSEPVSTVRVYLGMEYECPKGHRFFCSGPVKIIKVSSNSIVKDNASRLVNMDMPLYTSCHCKQPKGCLAQMMRVYIGTPRDSPNVTSVRVMINPMIQPSPPSPTPSSTAGCPKFHPGFDAPLELPPDGLWVMRLPTIYQDENRIYHMPTDHQQLQSCVLYAGMFTYKTL